MNAKPGDLVAWTKSFRFPISVDNDLEDISPEELCSCVKELKPPRSRRSSYRREKPSIAQYRTVPVVSGSPALKIVLIFSQDHLILD